MDYKLIKSAKRIDKRGYLVDFLKGVEMDLSDKRLGQIYFVTFAQKGTVRGNHYHKTKKEWFVAVKGTLKVVLEDVITKERTEFILKGDNKKYQKVFIGSKIAHTFVSLTKVAEMINYSNKMYDPESPDTHKYELV